MPSVADSIPLTEQENPRTAQITSLTTEEILRLMNEEDARVADAIAQVLPEISRGLMASSPVSAQVAASSTSERARQEDWACSMLLSVLLLSASRRRWFRRSLPVVTKRVIGPSKLRKMTRKPALAI